MKQLILQSVWVLVLASTAGLERGCEFLAGRAGADPNGVQVVSAAEEKRAASNEEIAMDPNETKDSVVMPIPRTEREWAQRLTREQYQVLRRKGTERPFTGQYYKHDENGVYTCAGCGAELFVSASKFDSHCGWPAFSYPKDAKTVVETVDRSHGMIRTEITCAKCGGHLGHVFNDGPGPTGLRYCINSVALDFEKETKEPPKSKEADK